MGMRSKTGDFLNGMLWLLSVATRPTMRNMMGGYESWAYSTGWERQLDALEASGHVESRTMGADSQNRVYRLSAKGRVAALGGRDPEACWARSWDGMWRMVLFDIPEIRGAERWKLRRYLRSREFGCLQNSVWISPHPVELERSILEKGKIHAESFMVLEGRPAAGESDMDLVEGAWDFEEINKRYQGFEEVLLEVPKLKLRNESAAVELRDWWRREREAWIDAVSIDPLLPRALWPEGYRGEIAWQARVKCLGRAAKKALDFRLPVGDSTGK
jgi:phenylacetic acid degradation operon negative regulatory protein